MPYLLSRDGLRVLEKLVHEQTLFAFDFDGTLAPIVEHPDNAAMRETTRYWLAQLAELFPCIILTGRARSDVIHRLEGVKLERIIGNHGAETESANAPGRRRVQGWKAALEAEVQSIAGVWVEDKGLSLAVHYRQCQHKEEARRRVLKAARGLGHARIFGGKQVVNLVDWDAPNKGSALATERARLGCKWAFFAGDDDNDEDAFALEGNLISVRIGRKKDSLARFYLRRQAEIDKLLETIVHLRL